MKTGKLYDVIVAGSGGAGLRAAIGALDEGCSVLVISKGKINRSGATLLAGANISADIAVDGRSLHEMGITSSNKNDSKDKWFDDTVYEGFHINNQELVEVFVNEAADRVKELMDWGMEIKGIEGERGISVFGSDILDSLFKACKEKGFHYLEDNIITDIVTEDSAVRGVICLDINSGEISYIPAKAVVTATGGAHNIFSMNSGSTDLCGEGQGAALRAGAPLVDMEFISFCPTVMLKPEAYKGNILPYIFQTLGYGKVKNKYGNEFTGRYLCKETEELALYSEWNKMLMSYVIQSEIQAGRGTMNGGIYQVLNTEVTNFISELYNDLPSLSKGIYTDILQIIKRGEALVVSPAAHYFEGGVLIDKNMATAVNGLFAAGECAGGLFGANRVSAATTEMLIEGAVAGRSAAKYASGADFRSASQGRLQEYEYQILKPFNSKGTTNVEEIKARLHEITSGSLWILRNGKALEAAFENLMLMNKVLNEETSFVNSNRSYNREWIEYLQLRNGLLCAAAIAKSALERCESRGVHVREDALYTDNLRFLKNCIIKNTNFEVEWRGVKGDRCLPEWGKLDYVDGIVETIKKLS